MMANTTMIQVDTKHMYTFGHLLRWRNAITAMRSISLDHNVSKVRYCQIKNEKIPGNPENMGISREVQGGTNFP